MSSLSVAKGKRFCLGRNGGLFWQGDRTSPMEILLTGREVELTRSFGFGLAGHILFRSRFCFLN